MNDPVIPWSYWIAFLMPCIYWGGALFNAYRIRSRTKHFPKSSPKGFVEFLLWMGWFCVIMGWFVLPWKVMDGSITTFVFLNNNAVHGLAVLLAVICLTGTWWCYRVLGDAWQLTTEQREKSLIQDGPYKKIRHPIYTFQTGLLFASFLCAPAIGLLMLNVLLVFLMYFKSYSEEIHLIKNFGEAYLSYSQKAGRFLPRFKS